MRVSVGADWAAAGPAPSTTITTSQHVIHMGPPRETVIPHKGEETGDRGDRRRAYLKPPQSTSRTRAQGHPVVYRARPDAVGEGLLLTRQRMTWSPEEPRLARAT